MDKASQFGVGIVSGVILGIVAAILPGPGFPPLIVAAVATLLLGILPPRRAAAWALCSGILVGSGGVFLYGTINTYLACTDTVGFCGGADVLPILVVALVALGVGSLVGLAALRVPHPGPS